MKQSDKLILSTILSLNIVSLGIGCINLKSVYADTTGTETSIVLSDDGTTVNGKRFMANGLKSRMLFNQIKTELDFSNSVFYLK